MTPVKNQLTYLKSVLKVSRENQNKNQFIYGE